jgi:formate dehydrogenase subunit delta
MSEESRKLVHMINQIARFFDGQSGDAASQTLQHLHSYWAPSMRRELVEFMLDGGEGLSPTARKAAEQLAEELVAASRKPNAEPHG